MPYHTFEVNDPSYLITFFIMLVTSLLTSALTTKEKLLTREANERGEESQILYMVSNRLSDASDIENVLKIAVESISRLMQVNVGCIYLGKQGEKICVSGRSIGDISEIDELRGKFANLRAEYLEIEDEYCYPVNGRESLLAVVKIEKSVTIEELSAKKKLLHSIIENIAMAMDRIEINVQHHRSFGKSFRIFFENTIKINGRAKAQRT